MTFSSDRIVKKIIIGNILQKKHACNNTYFNTFQARGTMVVLMTSPLSSMIKLTLKILTNVNTTGDIPLKKMASQGFNLEDDWFWQFYIFNISNTIYNHDFLYYDKSIQIMIYENYTSHIFCEMINDIRF